VLKLVDGRLEFSQGALEVWGVGWRFGHCGGPPEGGKPCTGVRKGQRTQRSALRKGPLR
jgi:hypothetical protein